MTVLESGTDSELLGNFLDESEDSLASVSNLFVELEKEPGNIQLIESIFRAAHSIKGMAAFLNLNFVKDLTHELETVLAGLRDNAVCINAIVVDCLLAGFDELGNMLNFIRCGKGEVENEGKVQELIEDLRSIYETGKERNANQAEEDCNCIEAVKEGCEVHENSGSEENEDSENSLKPASNALGRTMRVSEEKIDIFMNYVGDLIEISESFNFLQGHIGRHPDKNLVRQFKNVNSGFNQLSDKLQKSLLEIRKVPARSFLQKIPRMVRDLANTLGKKIEVEIAGEEILIDKSMVEALESPVNHLVRNCVDHGIELPEKRKEKGKDETGMVKISVLENGEDIIIYYFR